jgi:hypothetical protein
MLSMASAEEDLQKSNKIPLRPLRKKTLRPLRETTSCVKQHHA